MKVGTVFFRGGLISFETCWNILRLKECNEVQTKYLTCKLEMCLLMKEPREHICIHEDGNATARSSFTVVK